MLRSYPLKTTLILGNLRNPHGKNLLWKIRIYSYDTSPDFIGMAILRHKGSDICITPTWNFCGESFASDDVVYQCWVFPSWWVHFVKWTFPSCKKSERNFVSQAMNSDSPFFWPTSLNEMQFWFHRHVHRVPFNPKILLFFRSGRLWWWHRWFWDVQLEVSDMHQFCPNHDWMKSCEPVSITKYIYFVVSSNLKHMLVKLGHLSR